MAEKSLSAHAIVLFDGVCYLCDASVRFIVARDRRGHFRFAALQSEAAARLVAQGGRAADRLESVVLVEDGRWYTESEAAMRIARKLAPPWPLFYYFGRVTPRPMRDALYRFIARNRYRWFGKAEACLLPRPNLKARLLE